MLAIPSITVVHRGSDSDVTLASSAQQTRHHQVCESAMKCRRRPRSVHDPTITKASQPGFDAPVSGAAAPKSPCKHHGGPARPHRPGEAEVIPTMRHPQPAPLCRRLCEDSDTHVLQSESDRAPFGRFDHMMNKRATLEPRIHVTTCRNSRIDDLIQRLHRPCADLGAALG